MFYNICLYYLVTAKSLQIDASIFLYNKAHDAGRLTPVKECNAVIQKKTQHIM